MQDETFTLRGLAHRQIDRVGDRVQQRFDTGAGNRRYRKHRLPNRIFQTLNVGGDPREIALVDGDDPWSLGQLGGMPGQFANEDVILPQQALRLQGRRIEQKDEGPGAFDMTKELMPEPLAFGGSFNEPRYVRKNELTARQR